MCVFFFLRFVKAQNGLKMCLKALMARKGWGLRLVCGSFGGKDLFHRLGCQIASERLYWTGVLTHPIALDLLSCHCAFQRFCSFNCLDNVDFCSLLSDVDKTKLGPLANEKKQLGKELSLLHMIA